jgi:hypothetical protein
MSLEISLVIGTILLIALLALLVIIRSFVLSLDLDDMFNQMKSNTSGTLSTATLTLSEINKLKTLQGCITYLQLIQANFLDRLPDAWKEQIINHRKDSLENTSYTWSSYHDCPFVNQRLINDYKDIAHLDGSGRYRMIYKIMCSIASNAVEKGYPMSANEIVNLVKQIDAETSRRYEQRPLEVEANNALEFAYTNAKVI